MASKNKIAIEKNEDEVNENKPSWLHMSIMLYKSLSIAHL